MVCEGPKCSAAVAACIFFGGFELGEGFPFERIKKKRVVPKPPPSPRKAQDQAGRLTLEKLWRPIFGNVGGDTDVRGPSLS
jgi:hypothetical protein